MDPGEIPVSSWSSSLYDNDSRKWKYGVLYVTPQFIKFTEESQHSDNQFSKKTAHTDIIDVKKTLTGLIYRAIAITARDQTQLWLSSLPDYTSAYNVLQYFQHQNLISVQKGRKQTPSTGVTGTTEMGKKLLHSVHDSQNTLSTATNLLHQQGVQIESSMATMYDIHNDLDVADSILSGLESWLGKWTIPHQYKKESLEVVRLEDLPPELDYEVLYTKLEIGKMASQYLGIFRVSVDGLFILTDKQKVVHQFRWQDISVVKVLSLCEATVTHYNIGKPDLTYDLVCTNLLPVLRLLDKKLRRKVEYMEDVFKEEKKRKSPVEKNMDKLTGDQLPKGDNEICQPIVTTIPTSQSEQAIVTQSQHQKQIVSDTEVKEISRTLQNIKSVAMATQQELDVQLDNIDKLTGSVDRANERIDENVRQIKHMT